MAIIKDAEIHFVKCNPERPNAKYNKKNPTWEVQLRTTSKDQKKEWEGLNLQVKAVIPEDDSPPYYRVNLRKKSIKEKDQTPASPVEVKDGALNDVDPDTIGNGSTANIRIFQYEYPKDDKTMGTATVLMGIQLKRHLVYTPKPRDDDFQKGETERVVAEPANDSEDDSGPDDEETAGEVTSMGASAVSKSAAGLTPPKKAVAGF